MFSKHDREECKKNFTQTFSGIDAFNELLVLKYGVEVFQPFAIIWKLRLKFEFIFRNIDSSLYGIESALNFKLLFLNEIKEKNVVGINHCENLDQAFVSKFLNFRLKHSHETRFTNRKQLYASKYK